MVWELLHVPATKQLLEQKRIKRSTVCLNHFKELKPLKAMRRKNVKARSSLQWSDFQWQTQNWKIQAPWFIFILTLKISIFSFERYVRYTFWFFRLQVATALFADQSMERHRTGFPWCIRIYKRKERKNHIGKGSSWVCTEIWCTC